ncbi:MAG: FG-GAP-like repeat-containing protein, partial [Parvibaculum sp.]
MKIVRSTLAFALSGLLMSGPALAEADTGSDVPILKEEAIAAGIDHSYTGPWEFFVGGGAASFDCNGDRLPDLLLAGGTSPIELLVNDSPTGGALSFLPKDLGLAEEDLHKVLGAYPLDIDNDRHMDVVLLRLGRNIVLKGGPDCTFEKANRAFG